MLLAILLYAGSGSSLLLWSALGGALAALAGAAWYFIERGKRITHLSTALSSFDAASSRVGQSHKVLLEREGELLPANIRREEAIWRIEAPDETIEYAASGGGPLPVMADYELAELVREQLRPRRWALRCCGTCSYFAHSTTSREISGGWVAYCLRHASGPLLPEKDAVHIWHLCPEWDEGE